MVCFIKNGPVILEYARLDGDWKGNSAELIHDIGEVSKYYATLVISEDALREDCRFGRVAYRKDETIHLYSCWVASRSSLPIKVWSRVAYLLSTLRLLGLYRPRYIVASNMRFLLCHLVFCWLIGSRYIANFSRATQLNTCTFFLLRLFKVRHVITPGIHMGKVLRAAGVSAAVQVRLPTYPAEFFRDVPLTDFPSFPFTVLFVSRIERAKGIYEFVEAAIRVFGKTREIGFVILGNGGEYDDVRRRIEEAGCGENIRMLGFKQTTEIGSYLRRSDVLVFPSYTEGFAKTLLEAIYTQTPLVVTPLDSVRPYLEDRKSAWFVEVGSATDIETAILRLRGDSSLRLRMKAALGDVKNRIESSGGRSLKDIVLDIVSGTP